MVPLENRLIFFGTILSLQFLPADHRTLPFSQVYLLISTNSLISKSIFGEFILVLCPLKEMTNLKLIILCKYAVSVKYLKNHKQIITLSECIILCTQLTVVESSKDQVNKCLAHVIFINFFFFRILVTLVAWLALQNDYRISANSFRPWIVSSLE